MHMAITSLFTLKYIKMHPNIDSAFNWISFASATILVTYIQDKTIN